MITLYKFADPKQEADIKAGKVIRDLIELNIHYDHNPVPCTSYYTLNGYRIFELEYEMQSRGYDMKIVEAFGELRYEEGHNDSTQSFHEDMAGEDLLIKQ